MSKVDVFGIKKLWMPRSTMMSSAKTLQAIIDEPRSKMFAKSKDKEFTTWLAAAAAALQREEDDKVPAEPEEPAADAAGE